MNLIILTLEITIPGLVECRRDVAEVGCEDSTHWRIKSGPHAGFLRKELGPTFVDTVRSNFVKCQHILPGISTKTAEKKAITAMQLAIYDKIKSMRERTLNTLYHQDDALHLIAMYGVKRQ